jgi:hypothetical protein
MDAIATFAAQGHRYELDGVPVPSVTQAMALAGLDEYAGVPRRFLERAAAIGTAVHQATHFLDEDDLDLETVSSDIVGYVLSWQRFKATKDFSPIVIERRGISIGAGNELPFGFCLDRIGVLAGEEILLDLKTAKKRSPFWGVQTAAYCRGANFDGPRACVQLFSNGLPGELIRFPKPDDFDEWDRALGTAHWKLNRGKKLPF